MARIIWAQLIREETCQAPAAVGVASRWLPENEGVYLERKRNTGFCGLARESVMRG
ncbi:MAG: hypothetical protein OXF88_05240 [Rhodobacteraceae bacterium]|nr:hypothetical protein [Paracoccaceae bacterium]